MCIEDGKEIQAKEIENIFYFKKLQKISQILRKRWSSRERRILGLQTEKTKKEPPMPYYS
jgi:hypothetical protein